MASHAPHLGLTEVGTDVAQVPNRIDAIAHPIIPVDIETGVRSEIFICRKHVLENNQGQLADDNLTITILLTILLT